ncbi:cysteine protease StiP family protein [Psychrobacter sp.]|uniref:cysteine protease StiP family protein n=1 Tax=Psychrobacter sp. TaxID=56811 RepID=UPI0025E81026|nr:cysteine protease StiP family protein [Psychrobacter sp.]
MDSDKKTMTSHITSHSGSYLASDVTLLLDIVQKSAVQDVPVAQKEALIQTGQQHYSDMLTFEKAPTIVHEQMYAQALEHGKLRLARDIARLSITLKSLFEKRTDEQSPLILVSLVRAGLPVGVLLQRALRDRSAPYYLPSKHYGVSIIRDRGLDPVALAKILSEHPTSPIVFVDGWTGKGAIYGELSRSLTEYQDKYWIGDAKFENVFHQGETVIPLLTLADPAGVAWLSASKDDWLIPSGLLGSTVSGLISRTLYSQPNEDLTTGLHQSLIYHDLQDKDLSLSFIDSIESVRQELLLQNANILPLPTYSAPRYHSLPIVKTLANQYKISNLNRIKPTIAEATRAIMRRDPEQVLLASANHPDTALLRHLCEQKGVAVTVLGDQILPYQAVTIIKKRN